MNTSSEESRRSTSLPSIAAKALSQGRISEALALYESAGITPPRGEIAAAADRLLESGMIPSALRLCRRVHIALDREKLRAAVERQNERGIIYPELLDFMMTT